MANDLASNPWVFDTAAATILYQGDIEVRHMEFVDYGVQGSLCVVKDRYGKVVWKATGAADLEEVRSGPMGWIYGIAVTTLQNGGILRVYFV